MIWNWLAARPGVVFALGALAYLGAALGTQGFGLKLNSFVFGTDHLRFSIVWAISGGLMWAGGSLLLARAERPLDAIAAALERGSDRAWMIGGAAAGVLLPALIQALVLRGAPVTDDSMVYALAAEILASGHLTLPSPPDKLFWDNVFLVNDGRLYTQYMLGWPALLAPWGVIDGHRWANACYTGLLIPGLFLCARQLVGSRLARVTVALALSSPMLMIAGATQMSHTTCTLAITWTVWAWLKTRQRPESWWPPALLALGVCASVFIRANVGVTMLTPLVLSWLWSWWRGPRRPSQLVTFGAIALAGAGLFFWINASVYGHPLSLGYARSWAYSLENGLRYTPWVYEVRGGPDLSILYPSRYISTLPGALLHLNFVLLGWPLSYLFATKLSGERATTRHLLAMLASFLALHIFATSPGVEVFAPVHFFELCVPLLLLTAIGLATVEQRWPEREDPGPFEPRTWSRWPLALVVTGIALNLLGYVPVKLEALEDLPRVRNAPIQAVERARTEEPSVVFVDAIPLYDDDCLGPGVTTPQAYWRPMTHPEDRDAPIVWLNHTSLWADRDYHQRRYPERQALLLRHGPGCSYEVTSLDDASLEGYPPAYPWRMLEPEYRPPHERAIPFELPTERLPRPEE